MINARFVAEPFPHILVSNLLDTALAESVLCWLERDAIWTVKSCWFYLRHTSLNISERVAGTDADIVCAPAVIQSIRKHLERLFETKLDPHKVDLSAERALCGHRIGRHNDGPKDGSVTHRLVVYLNRGYDPAHGGRLSLFSQRDSLNESAVLYDPLHNSAVGKQFSRNSWHSLQDVRGGQYFSLRYAFWTDGLTSLNSPHSIRSAAPITGREFQSFLDLLTRLGTVPVAYGTGPLIGHLKQMFQTLARWRCDADVCKAGLFYGLMASQDRLRPAVGHSELARIILNAVGDRASLLIRLLNRYDLRAVSEVVANGRIEDGGASVLLSENDIRALVALVWAKTLQDIHSHPERSQNSYQLRDWYQVTAASLPKSSHPEIQSIWRGCSAPPR
jgi:hypothetical protein